MQLSTQQQAAKDKTIELLQHQPFVSLGGYAGTGKTTMIQAFVDHFKSTRIAAFTGKAAHVLQKKKMSASTIHRMMYKLIVDEKNKPILDEMGQLQWERQDLMGCEAIIIDEASMVPQWIYEDLLSFKIPIIFVGDHGQLPPVGDDFNIMEDPHVTLTEIHRNAGEIAQFAHHLRINGNPWDWKSEGAVHILDEDTPMPFHELDQCIAGFNKTRQSGNTHIRHGLGRRGNPAPGEPMIILQNDRERNIFNGQQGKVKSLDKYTLTLEIDDREVRIPVFLKQLDKKTHGTIAVDYAYFITCHKAQGDEYDTIGVYEEHCDYWERHRWNYTAASRAKQTIYWKPWDN